MATENTETPGGGVQIEETYNRLETFLEENQNIVLGVLGATILIVAAVVIYGRFILAPKQAEAARQVYMAQQWFEADSFRLALEGDGNYYGFYDIIDDYGATRVGKMARFYAGVSNLKLGNFDEAIDQLSKFKTSDPNVAAVALGGLGDAWAEQDNLEKAVGFYEKAAAKSNLNAVAPLYYLRAGKAHEELGNEAAAEKMYRAVIEGYRESIHLAAAEKNLARLTASSDF